MVATIDSLVKMEDLTVHSLMFPGWVWLYETKLDYPTIELLCMCVLWAHVYVYACSNYLGVQHLTHISMHICT